MGKPLVLGKGEGARYEARGSEMFFKALGSNTSGRLSLMDGTLPPSGRMPPPHRHSGNEEAYFVLDGDISFVLDGRRQRTACRRSSSSPAAWRTPSATPPTRPPAWVVIHAPALDGYFAELEQLWAGDQAPTPRAGTSTDEPPRDGAGLTFQQPVCRNQWAADSLVGGSRCLSQVGETKALVVARHNGWGRSEMWRQQHAQHPPTSSEIDGARARKARPRWEIEFFSSGGISAVVRSRPCGKKIGS